MANLCVLRRTDCELLHVARCDDAAACAAALRSGKAYAVEVVAVLFGLGPQLPVVQQRLALQVRCWWHAAPVAVVLSALAASMAEPEPAAAADAGPVGADAMESCQEEGQEAGPLQCYLEPCSIAEADKAVDVLRALQERLGKQGAEEVLRCARQVTLAGADGRKRRVFKAGHVRGEALRLKR